MNFNKSSSAFMALGFELIGLVVVLVLGGNYLDKNYGWGGWGVISGITVAFLGWVTHLYIVVQILAKAEKSGDTDAE